MLGLQTADIVVLVVYFIGVTLIGVWAARLVKNMGDFFMPRRFGKTMMVSHTFGTGTHSDQAVGVAAKTYVSGLSGIWYQWLWLFSTPFYWLIAPVMRRFRAITVSDVFVLRYGKSVGMLFAVVGTFNLMFNIGVMLKGSGAVISATLGNAVSPDVIILIMTALFVVYGVAGIIISLCTKPTDEKKLEQYYRLIRTPVNTNEGAPDEPCTIPEGVAVPEKHLQLKAGGLEVLRPGRSTVIGFAVAWIAVGAMILGFYLLTR